MKTFAKTLFDDICDMLRDYLEIITRDGITPKDVKIVISLLSAIGKWSYDHGMQNDDTYAGDTRLTDIQAMLANVMVIKKGPTK